MFSFLSSKNKNESVIVFDINAESVGAAVVIFEKNAIPRMVYTCREYFFDDKVKEHSSRRLIDAMKSALSRTELFLAKNIFSHSVFKSSPLKEIYYVFSDPWVEVKPKNLTAEKFLLKLCADFGVPKSAFVVVEGKVVLPKEIHDIVASADNSLREHTYVSYADILAELAKLSFSEEDFIDSDDTSDKTLSRLSAYFSRKRRGEFNV